MIKNPVAAFDHRLRSVVEALLVSLRVAGATGISRHRKGTAAVAAAILAGLLISLAPSVANAHFAEPGMNNAQLNVDHEGTGVFTRGSINAVDGKSFIPVDVAEIFQCRAGATDLRAECQLKVTVPTNADGSFSTTVAIDYFFEPPLGQATGEFTDCTQIQCALVAATYDKTSEQKVTSRAEHNVCFDGYNGCSWSQGGGPTTTSTSTTTTTTTTVPPTTTTTTTPPPDGPCVLRELAVPRPTSEGPPLFPEVGSGPAVGTDVAWTNESLADAPSPREGAAMAYDAKRGQTVLFGGFSSTDPCVLGDTWTWNGSSWTKQRPVHSPRARYGHAMAFDGDSLVLFGGYQGTTDLGDTWTWNGSDWIEHQDLDPTPSRRARTSMAYDAARQQVVLFGGVQASTVLDDTWTWQGGKWTLQVPPTSPVGRGFAAMAYHAPSQEVVLHGGWNRYPSTDTWAWNGATWTLKSRGQTPQIASGAMAFHPATGLAVLQPGARTYDHPTDDWAGLWDGSGWVSSSPENVASTRTGYTELIPVGPPARRSPAMAEDVSGNVVFFGGYGEESRPPVEGSNRVCRPVGGNPVVPVTVVPVTVVCTPTLGFPAGPQAHRADTWTLRTPGIGTAPNANYRVSVALDPGEIPADGKSTATATATVTRGGVPMPGQEVVFSNEDGDSGDGDVTFASPTGLTDASGRFTTNITASKTLGYETITAEAAVVDDPVFAGQGPLDIKVNGSAVLVERGMTLTLDPPSIPPDGSSTSVATVTLAQSGPLANEKVCFTTDGDVTFSTPDPPHCGVRTGDHTWSITVTASLTGGEETITARANSGLTASAVLDEGGAAWKNLTGTGPGPDPGRDGAAMAFDPGDPSNPDDDRTVLFGGHDGREESDALLGDTWIWDGATWKAVLTPEGSPVPGPTSRWGHSMAYDASSGDVVLFGGFDGTTYRNDTWTFDAGTGTWTDRSPTTSPSPRYMANMASDGTGVVLFSGTDGFAYGNSGPTDPKGPGHLRDTWTWRNGAWTDMRPQPPAPTTAAASFSNGQAIVVPLPPPSPGCPPNRCPADKANPYPSPIAVKGLSGTVADVKVTLHRMAYTAAGSADADIMVVAPDGTGVMVMSDACGDDDVTGLTLTFDDKAGAPLPAGGCVSGTFRPSDVTPAEENTPFHTPDAFPAPAPPFAASASLGRFAGVDPNGTWSLYVVDDGPNDINPAGEAGRIDGGWTIDISTTDASLSAVASPPPRGRAAIAYHPPTGKVVLYGGSEEFQFSFDSISGEPRGGSLHALADTWTWDGTAWAQEGSGTNPGPLHSASMAHHPGTDRLMLFGGSEHDEGRIAADVKRNGVNSVAGRVRPAGDTWAWDGRAWSRQSPSISPVARLSAAIAQDRAGRVVLFSGLGEGYPQIGRTDTWAWDPRVSVRLDPHVVAADGRSPSTAVVTVKDADGRPVTGLQGLAIRTDGDTGLSPVTEQGNGTYVATIVASTTGGVETLTVRTPLGSASVSLNEVGTVCSKPPPSSGTGTWAPVTPMLRAITQPAAATGRDGRILVFGGGWDPGAEELGLGNSGILSTVEEYDPCREAWQTLPSMPGGTRKSAAATAGPDGRIYVAGGTFAPAILAASGLVEAYTPGRGTTPGRWQTLPPLNIPRHDPAAAVGSDGRLYVMGGARSFGVPLAPDASVDSVEVFSPQTRTWRLIEAMPTPRAALAGVATPDGAIVAVGGEVAAGAGFGSTNTVDAYTLRTDGTGGPWEPAPPMSTARSYFSAAVGRDRLVYATGGINHAPLSPQIRNWETVEAYDECAKAWMPVTPMPTTRAYHATVAGPDGRIYVLGGVSAAQTDSPRYIAFQENPAGSTMEGSARVDAYTPDPNTAQCPTVNVSDIPVQEDQAQPTPARFTVTLNRPSLKPVVVNYATSDGTATAGVDYVAATGTVTLLPGQTRQTFDVTVLGDSVPEPTETFSVNVSPAGPGIATMAKAKGTASILDAGGITATPPELSIGDSVVAEAFSGTVPATFTVKLSHSATAVVSVDYATSDGSAVAGADYTAVTGRLDIPVGATTGTITVQVWGDTDPEATEDFSLALSSPAGATLAAARGTGTILDAEGGLSVGDASVTEGNAGMTAAVFTITLAGPADEPVTVDYTTRDGSATSPQDYIATTGTLRFEVGEQSKTVSVEVVGDTSVEQTEKFIVGLSNPTGAPLARDGGTGTIVDDDGDEDGEEDEGENQPDPIPPPSPPVPPPGPSSPPVSPLTPAIPALAVPGLLSTLPGRPAQTDRPPAALLIPTPASAAPSPLGQAQAIQAQPQQQTQPQAQVQQQTQAQQQAQSQAQVQAQSQAQVGMANERQREREAEQAHVVSRDASAQTYLASARRPLRPTTAPVFAFIAALMAAGMALVSRNGSAPAPARQAFNHRRADLQSRRPKRRSQHRRSPR